MTQIVKNKFFRVSLGSSKNVPKEINTSNVLNVVLQSADDVLTEDFTFLEPDQNNILNYKEDLIAKLEDDIFLWFHTFPSFPFLKRFLNGDVMDYYSWIKSTILAHGERSKNKYTEEDIHRIFTRQYEIRHHRKFYELFPSSSVSLRPCLEKNSCTIIWTLKNYLDAQQVEFELSMNTDVTLKDLASITLAENSKRIPVEDPSLLPVTLFPHIETIKQSYKYIQRLK